MKDDEDKGHFFSICLPNKEERDHVFPDGSLNTTERERVTAVPTELQMSSYGGIQHVE